MRPLSELRQQFAAQGRLDWIGLRPDRKVPVQTVKKVEVTPSGLTGDRGRKGPRAVTLIQAEHLAVIAALCGKPAVAPETLRRNLVVSGINLTALREHGIRIGDCLLQITVPCAPCSRMEQALGPGGYNAMRGHGGWCAEILEPGEIRIGDGVSAGFR